jgi:hypothetical protein
VLKWAEIPPTPQTPSARAWHAACMCEEGIILVGGHNGTACLNDAYIFTKEICWKKLNLQGNPPAPAAGMGCCYLGGDEIFFFGGKDSASKAYSDIFILDVHHWEWKKISDVTGTIPAAWGGYALAYVNQKDAIYAFGPAPNSPEHLAVFQLSLGNWQWTLSPSKGLPRLPCRFFGSAVLIQPDKIFLFGGQLRNGKPLNDQLEYNCSTNTFSVPKSLATGPSPRESQAVAFAPPNLMVLHGGNGPQGRTDDLFFLEFSVSTSTTSLSDEGIGENGSVDAEDPRIPRRKALEQSAPNLDPSLPSLNASLNLDPSLTLEQQLQAQLKSLKMLCDAETQKRRRMDKMVEELKQKVLVAEEQREESLATRLAIETALKEESESHQQDLLEMDRLEDRLKEADADVRLAKAEQDKAVLAMKNAQSIVGDLQAQIKAHLQKINGLSGEKEELKAKASEAVRDMEFALLTKRELDKEVTNLRIEVIEKGDKLEEAVAQRATAQARLEAKDNVIAQVQMEKALALKEKNDLLLLVEEEKNQRGRLRNALELSREETLRLETGLDEMKKECKEANFARETAESRCAAAESAATERALMIERLEENNRRLEGEMTLKSERFEHLLQDKTAGEKDREAMRESLHSVKERCRDLERKLQGRELELATLHETSKSREQVLEIQFQNERQRWESNYSQLEGSTRVLSDERNALRREVSDIRADLSRIEVEKNSMEEMAATEREMRLKTEHRAQSECDMLRDKLHAVQLQVSKLEAELGEARTNLHAEMKSRLAAETGNPLKARLEMVEKALKESLREQKKKTKLAESWEGEVKALKLEVATYKKRLNAVSASSLPPSPMHATNVTRKTSLSTLGA